MKNFSYRIEHRDGQARTGAITTRHGKIKTPVFMPVGTRASVKAMNPDELYALNTQIILGNTYHLYLKPGNKLIRRLGGLHRFMSWRLPILTDSGGFQVFSLGKGSRGDNLVKVSDRGVEFTSHIDGSKHFFTPKSTLDIQRDLGSDIAMVLDVCAPGKSNKDEAREAMETTHLWAALAKEYMVKTKPPMAVFGIVQGSTYRDLREESARFINGLEFDGNAIGGVAVGESKDKMYAAISHSVPFLSEDKPRYLMGVGEPEDILEAVEMGIDMFDCVAPTRIARNGTVYTRSGKLNLNNAKNSTDKAPIEKGCDCYACQNFSRAYIRHLLNVGEVLGIRLTTIHNLRFMNRLMEEIRDSINNGKFAAYKKSFLKKYRLKSR